MMQRRGARVGIGVGTAALVGVILYVAFWVAGSAIVFDKSGNVVSAVVTNSGGTTQPLYRLPGHTFYVIPQVEGLIEMRCRDGTRKQWGYVTGHMHTWLRVEPGDDCRRITEVR